MSGGLKHEPPPNHPADHPGKGGSHIPLKGYVDHPPAGPGAVVCVAEENQTTQPVYTCPGCRNVATFSPCGSDLWRCERCRWLTRLDGDRMQTAMPAALRSRPAKAKRVKRQPFDHQRLDQILRGGK